MWYTRHRNVTASRTPWGRLAAGCGSAVLLATATATADAQELRVELQFGAEADLDLYVTDPAQETIYFANTPSSASGGKLVADRRCDSPAPRVEVVRIENAPPGRYRIGVDYAEACGEASGAVPFRVRVVQGDEVLEREGEIRPRGFLPAVLELER